MNVILYHTRELLLKQRDYIFTAPFALPLSVSCQLKEEKVATQEGATKRRSMGTLETSEPPSWKRSQMQVPQTW